MEQVNSIIRAAQSGGSSALTLPGTAQLSRDSLVQLGTLLKGMTGGMPHQEYGEETTEIFLMTFEDLAVEFGVPNLEIALRRFLGRQKFFPHPAEVREVLEAMAQKKKAAMEATLPKLGCSLCMPIPEGETEGVGFRGFIYVERPGQPREVKLCECRLARARAKKELEAKA